MQCLVSGWEYGLRMRTAGGKAGGKGCNKIEMRRSTAHRLCNHVSVYVAQRDSLAGAFSRTMVSGAGWQRSENPCFYEVQHGTIGTRDFEMDHMQPKLSALTPRDFPYSARIRLE